MIVDLGIDFKIRQIEILFSTLSIKFLSFHPSINCGHTTQPLANIHFKLLKFSSVSNSYRISKNCTGNTLYFVLTL